MNFYDKMKNRWGVSGWRVLAILITFTLTGSTIVWVKRPVLGFLLPDDVAGWVYWTVYALIIVPLYQVILIIWGTLFGQFRFFWAKEKAMGRFLLRLVRPRANQRRISP